MHFPERHAKGRMTKNNQGKPRLTPLSGTNLRKEHQFFRTTWLLCPSCTHTHTQTHSSRHCCIKMRYLNGTVVQSGSSGRRGFIWKESVEMLQKPFVRRNSNAGGFGAYVHIRPDVWYDSMWRMLDGMRVWRICHAVRSSRQPIVLQ